MKTNQNLRRLGEKKGSNNKISHAEFISASSTRAVIVNDHNMRGRFRSARRTPGKFGMTIDNNHAFTLIELLVVVLIIGILASVALPQYQKAVIKSRYATLKNLTAGLARAQELYYLENNAYADKIDNLIIDMPGGKLDTSSDTQYNYTWGHCLLDMGGNSIRCDNDLISMGYQIYLEHSSNPNNRFCVVFPNTDPNSIYSQVCKSETGKTTHYNKNDNEFITWIY